MNSTKMGSSALTGCVINRNADFIEYQCLPPREGRCGYADSAQNHPVFGILNVHLGNCSGSPTLSFDLLDFRQ